MGIISEELLQQVVDKLSAIEARLGGTATKDDIANMATKDDIANMATKDDIANMATKDDIANMATKDDIANMATKDDISQLSGRMDSFENQLHRMEDKLNATFDQVARISEYNAAVDELAVTVDNNTTDIKLIKKLVANS